MNIVKTQLKSLVLSALMQSVVQQGIEFTAAQRTAILGFNEEMDAAEAYGDPRIDKTIDDIYESLLDAIDTLPEVL